MNRNASSQCEVREAEDMIRVCGRSLHLMMAGWILIGAAQAGEHVDRLDDSTVLLKLDPDYGDAVVEAGASELGGLLRSDARPLAGNTVRVLTRNEGPCGAISGPLAAWAPVFEELSGARVKLELAPVTDRYEVA